MPTPKESLIATHQLLHLTHHRNKNQHRLSKWYKSFSILRRQIAKLITELRTLETAELYSTAPGKGVVGEGENRYVMAARGKVESRVRFLRMWVFGDCFQAFSNLVADNQYSALGLVLLGSLARVKSILAQLVEEEDAAEPDAGKEGLMEVEGAEGPGDDFGEVVKRDGVLAGLGKLLDYAVEEGEDERIGRKGTRGKEKRPATEETEQLTIANLSQLELEQPGRLNIDKRPGQDMVVHAQRPRKKRKKAKGDAFDDLFSSLI
ncbi:hypothetical protein N431DRAFT_503242 [Stipitochalara longipes BDJ]|nr:hypothetical protein N431DRAFT_503242 [Stipitochalara longipes BDJ]